MNRLHLGLLACAAACFAVACTNSSTSTNQTVTAPTPAATAAAPAPPPADELAAARQTYAATCSRCHGDNGQGAEYDFEGKKMKAPSLRTGHATTHDDAHLARQISEGGDGMPAFKKRLTPEQINSLVRFIRRDFQAGPTGATGTTNGPANATGAHTTAPAP